MGGVVPMIDEISSALRISRASLRLAPREL